MEKNIPNKKTHAAIVAIEAMENILFRIIFEAPCFTVYLTVPTLIYTPTFISSLTMLPLLIVMTRLCIAFTIS